MERLTTPSMFRIVYLNETPSIDERGYYAVRGLVPPFLMRSIDGGAQ